MIQVIWLTFLAFTLGMETRVGAQTHIHRDTMISRPDTLTWHSAAHPNHMHEVVIALPYNNMAYLEAFLAEASDPASPKYQDWMSRERLLELIDNPQGYAAVMSWLRREGCEIVDEAAHGGKTRHFIRAQAPVHVWERLLSTAFHVWRDVHPRSSARHRVLPATAFPDNLQPSAPSGAQTAPHKGYVVIAERYSVPAELHPHILAIFHTCQAPFVMTSRAVVRPPVRSHGPAAPASNSPPINSPPIPSADAEQGRRSLYDCRSYSLCGAVSPMMLKQYYEIGNFAGSAAQSQAVFQTDADIDSPFFSTADVKKFMNKWNLAYIAPVYAHESDSMFDTTTCASAVSGIGSGKNCNEGNLDLQVCGVDSYNVDCCTKCALTLYRYSLFSALTYCSPHRPPLSPPRLRLAPQYIMGVAQNTRTVYWYAAASINPFLDWVASAYDDLIHTKILNVLVTSISYGATEQTIDAYRMKAFNDHAILMGIVGSTIVVASGDNGAAGTGVTGTYYACSLNTCNADSSSSFAEKMSYWSTAAQTVRPYWYGNPALSWTGNGYFPSFPATSPYVTSVGATMGPEVSSPEITCQSDSTVTLNGAVQSGVITSGGGFSTYYAAPWYQKDAIAKYFASAAASNQAFLGLKGYNPTGRGYPDVSFVGARYSTFVGGDEAFMFGTSASAPVFAAMISLVNALRAKKGKGPIGFVNPTLYNIGIFNQTFWNQLNLTGSATQIYTDITVGNNKCCARASNPLTPVVCCPTGFVTAPGWDPVTGWGSMPFTKFAAVFSVVAPFIPAAPTNSVAVSEDLPVFQIVTLVLIFLVLVGSVLFTVYYFARSSPSMRACLGMPPLVTPEQLQNGQILHGRQYPQNYPASAYEDEGWRNAPPLEAQARFSSGQVLPVMAHGYTQEYPQPPSENSSRLLSMEPVSFGRDSFPNPTPPYSQPFPQPANLPWPHPQHGAVDTQSPPPGTFIGPPPFISGPPPRKPDRPVIYGYHADGTHVEAEAVHIDDSYAAEGTWARPEYDYPGGVQMGGLDARHLSQHGSASGLERCPHCGVGFEDPVALVEHAEACGVPES